MARVTQVVVICSGAGTHVAAIDWRGERVDLLPGCPDCTPGFETADLPRPITVSAPLGGAETLLPALQAQLSGDRVKGLQWPRAPPV